MKPYNYIYVCVFVSQRLVMFLNILTYRSKQWPVYKSPHNVYCPQNYN